MRAFNKVLAIIKKEIAYGHSAVRTNINNGKQADTSKEIDALFKMIKFSAAAAKAGATLKQAMKILTPKEKS